MIYEVLDYKCLLRNESVEYFTGILEAERFLWRDRGTPLWKLPFRGNLWRQQSQREPGTGGLHCRSSGLLLEQPRGERLTDGMDKGENVRAMVWERAEMAQCQEQCWGILGTVPEVCSFTRFKAIEEYLHEEVKMDALAAVGCQEPFPVGRLSTGLVYAVRVFLKRVKLICPFITPFSRPRHLRHKQTRLH